MTTTIAILLFFIFLAIAGIHFYWAFGGKWAIDSVLPTESDTESKVLRPGFLASFIMGVGLLAIGFFLLIQAGLLDFEIPIWISDYGLLFIAGIFILRAIGDFKYVGFFKTIKQTKFGMNDTKYYSPLCLIIGLLTLLLKMLK